MSRRCVLVGFLLAGTVFLVGAGPRTEADRLLRDGYAAYLRGDLGLAAARVCDQTRLQVRQVSR